MAERDLDPSSHGSADDMAAGWAPGSAFDQPTYHAPRDSRGVLDGWQPSDGLEDVEEPARSAEPGMDISLHIDEASRNAHGSSVGIPTRPLWKPTAQEAVKPRRYPRPGESLAGFRIIAELGRGAFARVFLAEQSDLFDREVALKVAASLGDEPRNLARLQHTHIVPIHSMHDDPATGWRLICMPYMGGANLAQVIRGGARVPSQATGRSLIDVVDRLGHDLSVSTSGAGASAGGHETSAASSEDSASSSNGVEGMAACRGLGTPSMVRSLWGRYLARLPWVMDLAEDRPNHQSEDERQPARLYLKTATYVQAAVWIIARLAEGLQHAHERGLVHRDIKPSNILIAADGTPMLLDFNLSAEVVRISNDEEQARTAVGGTLPYMAPEHLDAFSPDGDTPPEAVGEAADIYSLGLILFEMVAGEHPFADPPGGPRIAETIRFMREERLRGAPPARGFNPQVPWGLEAILARCLDPEPTRRYASAGDLAEDLRRLLDDRPLKHVPEPSVREVFSKWARRNPRASSATTMSIIAGVLLMMLGTASWAVSNGLKDAKAQQHLVAFDEIFSECQLLLNTDSGPIGHLDRGVMLAGNALESYAVRDPQGWVPPPSVDRLPEDLQRRLREQISELIALRERAVVMRCERLGAACDQRETLARAIEWLDLAEHIDPNPSFALYIDRASYREVLGQPEEARADRDRAAARPPVSARDLTLLGTALLARGKLDQAEAYLDRAASLEPERFWSLFALALCHFQQERYTDAASEFWICTMLAPEFAWPHLNRGLALTRAGRLPEARNAYDRALTINPDFIAARLNRALVCLELGDPAAALSDLNRAVALGNRDAATLAARAEALAHLGRHAEADRDFANALERYPDDIDALVARGFFRLKINQEGEARLDFERVLALDPENHRAHLGMAHELRGRDPHAALSHLERALEDNPAFADAFQLRALILARLGDSNAELDINRLALIPTPHRLYNAACALAILHHKTSEERYAERSLHLLGRALDLGFDPKAAFRDSDLQCLKDRPGFRKLFQFRLRFSQFD